MQNLPFGARLIFIIGIFLLLFFPLAMLALRQPAISTQVSTMLHISPKPITTKRYRVVSNVSGYTIDLIDSAYLDYMTAKMDLFGMQKIVDPTVYYGSSVSQKRSTVTSVRFALVPSVLQPIAIITSPLYPTDFLGKGEYDVENDVLVVRVWLNFPELNKNILTKEFSLQDTYVRTALWTLQYATGFPLLGSAPAASLFNLQQDMKDNLYSGIFPWPIRIQQVKL